MFGFFVALMFLGIVTPLINGSLLQSRAIDAAIAFSTLT
jgi:hypothetical protein